MSEYKWEALYLLKISKLPSETTQSNQKSPMYFPYKMFHNKERLTGQRKMDGAFVSTKKNRV